MSPSTAARDRTIKLDIYRREGVRHLWFLDPLARTLEVLTLDGAGYRITATHSGPTAVRAEPFDAIELDFGLLWLPSATAASDTEPCRHTSTNASSRWVASGSVIVFV